MKAPALTFLTFVSACYLIFFDLNLQSYQLPNLAVIKFAQSSEAQHLAYYRALLNQNLSPIKHKVQ